MESFSSNDSAALRFASFDHKNHKNLQYLFQHLASAVAALEGPQHIYTFVNPLYQKIFRRTEDQLFGKPYSKVFSGTDGQEIGKLFD